jgi:hypothetical protein
MKTFTVNEKVAFYLSHQDRSGLRRSVYKEMMIGTVKCIYLYKDKWYLTIVASNGYTYNRTKKYVKKIKKKP